MTKRTKDINKQIQNRDFRDHLDIKINTSIHATDMNCKTHLLCCKLQHCCERSGFRDT